MDVESTSRKRLAETEASGDPQVGKIKKLLKAKPRGVTEASTLRAGSNLQQQQKNVDISSVSLTNVNNSFKDVLNSEKKDHGIPMLRKYNAGDKAPFIVHIYSDSVDPVKLTHCTSVGLSRA